jgi:hypothetical protein
MKSKLPFVVNYTKEMSEKFNKELKESGKCSMTNPNFYGNWTTYEVGTPEYEKVISKKKRFKLFLIFS